MLTVKNVTKCYGNFTVLENMSLVLENSIYGLLASNGAGKSTIIKILATFQEANNLIARYIHFYNHERNWSGAADAAPLRIKLNISYIGAFLYCPHKLEKFKENSERFRGRVMKMAFS